MIFPKQSFEKKMNVKIATSGIMDNAIELWRRMYQNCPPWLGGEEHVKSLNLPAAIAEEMSRLVMTEFHFEVTGSPRADYINEQMNHFLDNMHNTVEMWAALGGIIVKPYAVESGQNSNKLDQIDLDVVMANRFYPTTFNSNKEITGAVFIESKRIGDYLYTRLEHHKLEGTTYTVINKAFKSERINTLTTEDDQLSVEHPFQEEVSLETVDDWKGLQPEVTLQGIDRPLFVYVKIPRANNVDPHSPLGASVYSRVVTQIEEADRQFSRILWEYEASEAAVDADATLFDTDKHGHPVLPRGKERLYRSYNFEGSENGGFLKEYAPQIRDSSLFNGLNELMRKIEFQCGLAYGTLSDPNETAKTATEIKTSKQRSYTTVSAMQTVWTAALEDVVHIMDMYCTLYNMAPAGESDVCCTWGDGVLEDVDMEYQRRWAMVVAGKYKLEKFYAWYFGCTEDEAKELIPDASPSLYPPIE